MAGALIATGTSLVAGQLSGNASGEAVVTLSQTPVNSGYARALGEVDAGRVTGTAFLLAPETSEDFRSRVELDSLLDSERFVYTAQNTSKHIYRNTTMTATWTATGLTTNASAIATTGTGVLFQTRQFFPVFGGAQTYVYVPVVFTTTWGVTNKVIDIGLFTANATTPYAPTDGVFIRANSSGLFGVKSVGGVETTSSVFKVAAGGADFAPTVGTSYSFIITISNDAVVFWCDLRDGTGYVQMARIVSSVGDGVTIRQMSLPFAVRDANTGTTSAVQGVRIPGYTVTQGGFNTGRSWAETSVGMGGTGAQGQSGHTQGANSNYTNNMAAGAGAVLTNTTAAASALKVQVGVLPTLAVGTDGILTSYLNPVPTTSLSGKTFFVRGVKLRGAVTTVLAGNATPVVYVATMGFGHTAVSRATTETATTKAPRIIDIGYDSYAAAAAVGTLGQAMELMLPTPQAIQPGEYVDIALKNIGAVTTTGVILYQATIFGYWGA